MKRVRQGKQEGPKMGGFTLRGSWNEDGSPTSPLTEFVRMVRRERVHPGMTPAEFVERIPETFAHAFPNRCLWAETPMWADCPTSTSAESTVVYAFKSKHGDLRATPDTYDPDVELQQNDYFPHLSEVAARINKGCAMFGATHPYDPRRMAAHRLHGEMVAQGITEPNEIVRVVAHHLKATRPESILEVPKEA